MHEDKKEKITYRSLEPGMSEALVKCIRNVYGDSYPLSEFYNPDAVESLLKQKLLFSEVAIDKNGDIVATLSTQLKNLPARSVYIPEAYRDQIDGIYKQIKCDRKTLTAGKDKLPHNSTYKTSLNVKTAVISMHLERAGADLMEVLGLLDTAASKDACEVQYIDLPLDNPGCGLAVEMARDNGFLYGGLILERSGSDRLRLQKLDSSTFLPEDIKISSEEALSFLNHCLTEMGGRQFK
jgi:hypothetical protein